MRKVLLRTKPYAWRRVVLRGVAWISLVAASSAARSQETPNSPADQVSRTGGAGQTVQLQEILVDSSKTSSPLGPPPPPYAGGQVATGGQLGFLGNRGVMDTPFNQTSYTAKTIQDQQAKTIADVVDNDPSVRNVSSAGSGIQVFFIRGFYYDSGDLSLNGLYGLAPLYSTAANFVERVEVLKGPSALLSGISPAGAVGGSINLVTKKAPDVDIAQITPFFVSRSQFGVDVDVSKRAGDNKEFGIRFNGEYRGGHTPFDHQTDEFGDAVVNADYRGEHIRVSVDAGYQTDNINSPLRYLFFLPSVVPIPPAPRAGTNFIVPWAFLRPRDTFALARAEVDITDWATIYGAFGYHDSTVNFVYPSPTVIDGAGDYLSRAVGGYSRFQTMTGETGIRAKGDTGPIHHSLSFNYSAFDRPNDNVFRAGSIIASNIYNPLPVPPQDPSLVLINNRLGTSQSSVGVADTASILNERIQLTAGVRRQTAGTSTFDNLSGAATNSEASVYSPAFAVLVKPFEKVSLYANYIEGLQSGQTIGPGFANAGSVIPPFQTKQAEAGVKVDTGRLTTTLSVFQITQPSIITTFVGALPSQTLGGEQRNSGVELNVFGEVTSDIRVLGGVAFIDGRLTKTDGGLNDGKKAPGVADINLNIGAEVDLPYLVRGLTATGRVIYTGSEFIDPANTQQIPAWTRVDLGARYTFTSPFNGKPIVLRASVENVANLGYYMASYNGVVGIGAPRTYLASATFNF